MNAATRPADLMPTHHPVYARLTTPDNSPFARHCVLHELQQRAQTNCAHKRALAARVAAFVERGVPYFAPADRHYRDWVANAVALWDEVAPA
jgi:hypothetical protein